MPAVLRSDTPGAPLPATGTVGGWEIFGAAQTGQLDKSNTDKAAVIAIVEACEKRDAQADAAIVKHKRKL